MKRDMVLMNSHVSWADEEDIAENFMDNSVARPAGTPCTFGMASLERYKQMHGGNLPAAVPTSVLNHFDASDMYEEAEQKASVMQQLLKEFLNGDSRIWKQANSRIGFTPGDTRYYVTIYKTPSVPIPPEMMTQKSWMNEYGEAVTRGRDLMKMVNSLETHFEDNPQKPIPGWAGHMYHKEVFWPVLTAKQMKEDMQGRHTWGEADIRSFQVMPLGAAGQGPGKSPKQQIVDPAHIMFQDIFPEDLIQRIVNKCLNHFRKLFPQAGKNGYRYAVTAIGVIKGGNIQQFIHNDIPSLNHDWAAVVLEHAGCIPCSFIYEILPYNSASEGYGMLHRFSYVDPNTNKTVTFDVETQAPNGLAFTGAAKHAGMFDQACYRLHVHIDVEGLYRLVDVVDHSYESPKFTPPREPNKFTGTMITAIKEQLKETSASTRHEKELEDETGKEEWAGLDPEQKQVMAESKKKTSWVAICTEMFENVCRYKVYHRWFHDMFGQGRFYTEPGTKNKGGSTDRILGLNNQRRFLEMWGWDSQATIDLRSKGKRKANSQADVKEENQTGSNEQVFSV
jgi:hypothetical protein